MDEATYTAAAEGGALAAAQALVQQPSPVWRRGNMLVSLLDETVMVSEGVPERVCALGSVCSGAAAKAEPAVTMPGQLVALEVQKGPNHAEACVVLCRSRGAYWAVQVRCALSSSDVNKHTSYRYGDSASTQQQSCHVAHACLKATSRDPAFAGEQLAGLCTC